MRRMNFRQRIAWLLVAMYLAGTCYVAYYMFEISDKFNEVAVDHVSHYHKKQPSLQEIQQKFPDGKPEADSAAQQTSFSVFSHVTDIPLAVWMLILVIPYLQVFSMLFACTRPEPRVTLAFLWPYFVYLKCKHLLGLVSATESSPVAAPLLVSVKCHPQNGSISRMDNT